MNKQIKFFALFLSLFAALNGFAQGAGKVSYSDIHFAASEPANWTVKSIPATATTGQFVLAVSKTDRGQLLIDLREGKIAQVSYKTADGSIRVLSPSASPCSTIHCAANQLSHCFQTPSGCVCICGSWITLYPGN